MTFRFCLLFCLVLLRASFTLASTLYPRHLFVVTLRNRLGFHDRKKLWKSYHLHHERHIYKNPASYLLSVRQSIADRLSKDELISTVERLAESEKSSFLLRPNVNFLQSNERTLSSDTNSTNSTNYTNSTEISISRNGTLEKEIELICNGDPLHEHQNNDTLAPDIREELSQSFTNEFLHPNITHADGSVDLEVTTLCFYNSRDCSWGILGRRRTLISILGAEEASFVDDVASERNTRVLILRIPRNISVCGVTKKLAKHPLIVRIELRQHLIPLNAFAAAAVQSGAKSAVNQENAVVWNSGILGQGEVVGVGDTGVDMDSCYFRERSKKGSEKADQNFQQRAGSTGSHCDMTRRKIVCYFTTERADFGDDSSIRGGGHGTHVTGTIGGLHQAAVNGSNDVQEIMKAITGKRSQMNGVAPLSKLSVNDIGSTSGRLYPPVDFATSSFLSDPYAKAGVRIHSNSWGCGASGRSVRTCNKYSVLARSMDEFMWLNKDAVVVVAAGNSGDVGMVDLDIQSKPKYKDGYYTVGAPATFKNGVSVGATQRGEPKKSCAGIDGKGEPCSFENLFSASSRGPTMDGRIKPDVVFPGEKIVSAYSSGNTNDFTEGTCAKASVFDGLHVISGTSMACPGVAGTLALIRQYYREVNPHTGDRKDQKKGPLGDGFGPSGALLKATLIASAIPLSGHFTYRSARREPRKSSTISETENPKHLSGYGRPQLDQVLRLSTSSSRRLLVIDRHSIAQGAREHKHVFQVGRKGTWKAILTYTDAPGPVQEAFESGPVLINDLDLFASCSKPSDCNISGADLTSDSRVDNTEMVPKFNGVRTYVVALTSTKVTVRVVPKSIVTEKQPYALVIVGTKLNYTPERSTHSNWKPDWSLAVKKPGATTQVREVQNFAVTVAIIVVSVLALAVCTTGIWYFCRKKDPAHPGNDDV